MAGGDTNGMATALALAGGFGDAYAEGEQEALFADADDAPGSLTPAKRPAHRPKGARNRSTEEWRRFFLSRFASPLIGCGETYSRSAEDLARELFLTRTVALLAPGQLSIGEIKNADGKVTGYLVWDLDRAFAIQQEARAIAMPYVHQRQPLALEVQNKPRGLLVLDLGASTGGNGADDDFVVPFAPRQQNQQVSDAEIVQSDATQSDATPNRLEYKDDRTNGH
jgi:hypothetical protein